MERMLDKVFWLHGYDKRMRNIWCILTSLSGIGGIPQGVILAFIVTSLRIFGQWSGVAFIVVLGFGLGYPRCTADFVVSKE